MKDVDIIFGWLFQDNVEEWHPHIPSNVIGLLGSNTTHSKKVIIEGEPEGVGGLSYGAGTNGHRDVEWVP